MEEGMKVIAAAEVVAGNYKGQSHSVYCWGSGRMLAVAADGLNGVGNVCDRNTVMGNWRTEEQL